MDEDGFIGHDRGVYLALLDTAFRRRKRDEKYKVKQDKTQRPPHTPYSGRRPWEHIVGSKTLNSKPSPGSCASDAVLRGTR